jgi:hypothetical protein
MSVSQLGTIERIAERYGVEVQTKREAGRGSRRVIILRGQSSAIEHVLKQIDGYNFCWHGSDFGDPPPSHKPEDTLAMFLYSSRANWAEAGY